MSVSEIQTGQQPFELLWFDVNDLLIARGPVKMMLFKSLEPKGKAVVWSQYNILIMLRCRLQNTNRSPSNGLKPIACSTKSDSPLIDLRMSVTPAAKNTRLKVSGPIIRPPP
jgi:hypothetical protein